MITPDKLTKTDIQKLKFIKSYEGDTYYTLKFIEEHKNEIINVHSYDDSKRYAAANIIKNSFGGIICDLTGSQQRFLEKLGVHFTDAKFAHDIAKKISEVMAEQTGAIDEDTAKPKEKQYFAFIRDFSRRIARECGIVEREMIFVRKSPYEACTDGEKYIKFNMGIMNLMASKVTNTTKVGLILLHEYCHDGNSENGSHDVNFYERYHSFSQKCRELLGNMVCFNFSKGELGKIDFHS